MKDEPVVGPRADIAADDAVVRDRLAVGRDGQRCGQEGRADDLGHFDSLPLTDPGCSKKTPPRRGGLYAKSLSRSRLCSVCLAMMSIDAIELTLPVQT